MNEAANIISLLLKKQTWHMDTYEGNTVMKKFRQLISSDTNRLSDQLKLEPKKATAVLKIFYRVMKEGISSKLQVKIMEGCIALNCGLYIITLFRDENFLLVALEFLSAHLADCNCHGELNLAIELLIFNLEDFPALKEVHFKSTDPFFVIVGLLRRKEGLPETLKESCKKLLSNIVLTLNNVSAVDFVKAMFGDGKENTLATYNSMFYIIFEIIQGILQATTISTRLNKKYMKDLPVVIAKLRSRFTSVGVVLQLIFNAAFTLALESKLFIEPFNLLLNFLCNKCLDHDVQYLPIARYSMTAMSTVYGSKANTDASLALVLEAYKNIPKIFQLANTHTRSSDINKLVLQIENKLPQYYSQRFADLEKPKSNEQKLDTFIIDFLLNYFKRPELIPNYLAMILFVKESTAIPSEYPLIAKNLLKKSISSKDQIVSTELTENVDIFHLACNLSFTLGSEMIFERFISLVKVSLSRFNVTLKIVDVLNIVVLRNPTLLSKSTITIIKILLRMRSKSSFKIRQTFTKMFTELVSMNHHDLINNELLNLLLFSKNSVTILKQAVGLADAIITKLIAEQRYFDISKLAWKLLKLYGIISDEGIEKLIEDSFIRQFIHCSNEQSVRILKALLDGIGRMEEMQFDKIMANILLRNAIKEEIHDNILKEVICLTLNDDTHLLLNLKILKSYLKRTPKFVDQFLKQIIDRPDLDNECTEVVLEILSDGDIQSKLRKIFKMLYKALTEWIIKFPNLSFKCVNILHSCVDLFGNGYSIYSHLTTCYDKVMLESNPSKGDVLHVGALLSRFEHAAEDCDQLVVDTLWRKLQDLSARSEYKSVAFQSLLGVALRHRSKFMDQTIVNMTYNAINIEIALIAFIELLENFQKRDTRDGFNINLRTMDNEADQEMQTIAAKWVPHLLQLSWNGSRFVRSLGCQVITLLANLSTFTHKTLYLHLTAYGADPKDYAISWQARNSLLQLYTTHSSNMNNLGLEAVQYVLNYRKKMLDEHTYFNGFEFCSHFGLQEAVVGYFYDMLKPAGRAELVAQLLQELINVEREDYLQFIVFAAENLDGFEYKTLTELNQTIAQIDSTLTLVQKCLLDICENFFDACKDDTNSYTIKKGDLLRQLKQSKVDFFEMYATYMLYALKKNLTWVVTTKKSAQANTDEFLPVACLDTRLIRNAIKALPSIWTASENLLNIALLDFVKVQKHVTANDELNYVLDVPVNDSEQCSPTKKMKSNNPPTTPKRKSRKSLCYSATIR